MTQTVPIVYFSSIAEYALSQHDVYGEDEEVNFKFLKEIATYPYTHYSVSIPIIERSVWSNSRQLSGVEENSRFGDGYTYFYEREPYVFGESNNAKIIILRVLPNNTYQLYYDVPVIPRQDIDYHRVESERHPLLDSTEDILQSDLWTEPFQIDAAFWSNWEEALPESINVSEKGWLTRVLVLQLFALINLDNNRTFDILTFNQPVNMQRNKIPREVKKEIDSMGLSPIGMLLYGNYLYNNAPNILRRHDGYMWTTLLTDFADDTLFEKIYSWLANQKNTDMTIYSLRHWINANLIKIQKPVLPSSIEQFIEHIPSVRMTFKEYHEKTQEIDT